MKHTKLSAQMFAGQTSIYIVSICLGQLQKLESLHTLILFFKGKL